MMNKRNFKLLIALAMFMSFCSKPELPSLDTQVVRGIALYQLMEHEPQLFEVHVSRLVFRGDTSYLSYSMHNNYNHVTGLVEYDIMESRPLFKHRIKKFFPYP